MAVSVGKYSFIIRVMPWMCSSRLASDPRHKILILGVALDGTSQRCIIIEDICRRG